MFFSHVEQILFIIVLPDNDTFSILLNTIKSSKEKNRLFYWIMHFLALVCFTAFLMIEQVDYFTNTFTHN